MMEPVQAPGLIIPSKASAIGRFGKYKADAPQDVRAPIAKNDPTLDRFLDIWQRLECRPNDEILFDKAEPLVAGFKCTAEDIRRFVLTLPVYRNTEERLAFKAGTLLTMLILNSDDAGFLIPSRDISIPLDWIGSGCSKHILIDGDAGDFVGGMKGGRLVINGNVGNFAGNHASGCDILVKGNAGRCAGMEFSGKNLVIKGDTGDSAGYLMKAGVLRLDGCAGAKAGEWMKGGLLHVRGNAGRDIGDWMKGGIIRVDGEIKSIGDVKCGKIFHKGKLIVDMPDVEK